VIAGVVALSACGSAAAPRASVNVYAATMSKLSPAVAALPERVYVADAGSGGVTVVDARSGRITALLLPGLSINAIVASWDLHRLYALSAADDEIVPIDASTLRAGTSIRVSHPDELYFSPDGREGVVIDAAARTLDVRAQPDFGLERRVMIGCAATSLDFTADGTDAVATCPSASTIVEVALATGRVVRRDMVGGNPTSIRLDPTGRAFFITDHLLSQVDVVDAAALGQPDVIVTENDPSALALSRDTHSFDVANQGSDSVSVISVAHRERTADLYLRGGFAPDGIQVSADGRTLWMSDSADKVIGTLSAGRPGGRVAVPAAAGGILVWPQPGRHSLGGAGLMR